MSSYTMYKNELKWIEDLNIRLETITFLKESISTMLFDISFSSILGYMYPQAIETKTKINK